MIALDTCVLARMIIGDDQLQQVQATKFIASNRCSVSWSVLVELCWVLERSALLPKERVIAAMSMLNEIAEISVPDATLLDWAIERYEKGADFPDMVHLASAMQGSTAFATFDRKLGKQAGDKASLDVIAID